MIARNNSLTSLSIKVKRNGEEKTLSGPLFKGYAEARNYVGPIAHPTDLQKTTLHNLISD